MSETFRQEGSAVITPQYGSVPGASKTDADLSETVALTRSLETTYRLSSDSPQAVALGALTNVNVLLLRATGKVRVRITSADGSTQSIPCDPRVEIISLSVPITAIDLTRVTGVRTDVAVLLGEV